MNHFHNIKEYYPTPPSLAKRMVKKLKNSKIYNVLDPSAGKGDLLKAYSDYWCSGSYDRKPTFSAIEIESELQSVLRADDISVVDADFLTYSGGDQFDAIVMNPPFSNGDLHLLKAINILYSGEIVCVLNAETLRNPYTKTRQDLWYQLTELDAKIEYLQQEFVHAERKTNVEIALIHLVKEANFEDDITKDMSDEAKGFNQSVIDDETSIVKADTIHAMIERYENAKAVGIETIINFYKKYRYIGKYIRLELDSSVQTGKLTERVKKQVNQFLTDLRKDYWLKAMDLPDITKNLTEAKRAEFTKNLNKNSKMDFTLHNLRTFAANLSGSYMDTLIDAAESIFDDMTRKYAWSDETSQNILHYNGWKTNDAFRVNSKVIMPHFRHWDAAWGKWRLDWSSARRLDDIDKVMSYFHTGDSDYLSMRVALERAFEQGQSRNIISEFFIINCYKKGTMHLVFRDEGILRRFNTVIGKRKNWLPCDYGEKPYSAMTPEEQSVTDEFEGEKTYTAAYTEGLPELAGFSTDNDLLRLEVG